MNSGDTGVAEVQERKAGPRTPGKMRGFPFLVGIVALIALVAIGIELLLRLSRTQPTREHLNGVVAITATVLHPQKVAFKIPVLPGRTQAYTDAPIFAQTSGYLKNWYFDI